MCLGSLYPLTSLHFSLRFPTPYGPLALPYTHQSVFLSLLHLSPKLYARPYQYLPASLHSGLKCLFQTGLPAHTKQMEFPQPFTFPNPTLSSVDYSSLFEIVLFASLFCIHLKVSSMRENWSCASLYLLHLE